MAQNWQTIWATRSSGVKLDHVSEVTSKNFFWHQYINDIWSNFKAISNGNLTKSEKADLANAYFNKGIAHKQQKDFPAALKALEEACYFDKDEKNYKKELIAVKKTISSLHKNQAYFQ